jgi:hypothetical protein
LFEVFRKFGCFATSRPRDGASDRAGRTAFQSGLYPILEKASCRACHNADGVASATRLHFPDADAPAEDRGLRQFAGRSGGPRASRSISLLRKPTARIAHTGGERIKPGSPEEAVLKAWIDHLTQALRRRTERRPALSGTRRHRRGRRAQDAELRRLTHSQYNHTVRDLLGDQTDSRRQFPPEDFVNGFRNQSRGQSLSPLLVEAYSSAAEAAGALGLSRRRYAHLIPCKPSAACRARFVREFGQKAFRRPLDAGEQKRYEALMAQ